MPTFQQAIFPIRSHQVQETTQVPCQSAHLSKSENQIYILPSEMKIPKSAEFCSF